MAAQWACAKEGESVKPNKYFIFDVSKPLHFVNIGNFEGGHDYVHVRRIMPDYELFVVKGGRLNMTQGEYEFHANEGDVFFHLPNVIHAGTEPHYVDFYWLHFTCQPPLVMEKEQLASKIRQDEEFLRNKIVVPQFFSLTNKQLFFMKCGNLFNSARTYPNQTMDDYAVTTVMLELTKQVVKELFPDSTRISSKIQTALVYIQDNINVPFTVADVAETCMCHEKYLAYLFKKELGISPKQYVTRKKMDLAKAILLSTNCSVRDVAAFTGYEDEHLFMRQFHKETGMTPTQYRLSAMGKDKKTT